LWEFPGPCDVKCSERRTERRRGDGGVRRSLPDAKKKLWMITEGQKLNIATLQLAQSASGVL